MTNENFEKSLTPLIAGTIYVGRQNKVTDAIQCFYPCGFRNRDLGFPPRASPAIMKVHLAPKNYKCAGEERGLAGCWPLGTHPDALLASGRVKKQQDERGGTGALRGAELSPPDRFSNLNSTKSKVQA